MIVFKMLLGFLVCAIILLVFVCVIIIVAKFLSVFSDFDEVESGNMTLRELHEKYSWLFP